MARVKRGTISRPKHKKVLKQTRGYRMTKSKLIKVAKEASLHAGQYAYIGRKQKKRNIRRLWITRIKSSVKKYNFSYNLFIHALSQKKIVLDRKILAYLATEHDEIFKKIVEEVKK